MCIRDSAYTQNPKSAPSRACILTGKYSWQLKEATNHFPHFPSEFTLYPQVLINNGYHVGFTGKGWGPGTYDTKDNPAGPEYNKLTVKKRPAKGIFNTEDVYKRQPFITASSSAIEEFIISIISCLSKSGSNLAYFSGSFLYLSLIHIYLNISCNNQLPFFRLLEP